MPDDFPRLALYHHQTCVYCLRVRSVIADLGLQVPLRDTNRDAAAEEELFAARGRGTVPVLRIEERDGSVRWMPESQDIIRYLRELSGPV